MWVMTEVSPECYLIQSKPYSGGTTWSKFWWINWNYLHTFVPLKKEKICPKLWEQHKRRHPGKKLCDAPLNRVGWRAAGGEWTETVELCVREREQIVFPLGPVQSWINRIASDLERSSHCRCSIDQRKHDSRQGNRSQRRKEARTGLPRGHERWRTHAPLQET